ncbi:GntR family transcriptional regulator [Paenibacillus filicis]|uniref:GntR family transcriptional regulator n=1 Tax=Paenibacillus gyeongsangnamensis TaxID=3388067 RepID=A0ABT4QJ21_9BACL|nr:GntR family transcriptional regulator [Paenibacillus filicis]MCZ8516845.1 GntR family transcriptional regulator [Paenibacillus filicis]
MIEIKAVKKITVTEQIMEQIAELIRSGQLKPGDQLPTERDLAERLGVTRGRVREALRALSLVGLIEIRAGEGSFVTRRETPLSKETIVWMFHHEIGNLDEVYAARKLIETEVYVAVARMASAGDIESLELLLDEIRRKLETGSVEEHLNLLDRLDLRAGELCGNGIYSKLMQTMVHLRRETSLRLLSVPGAKENGLNSRSQVLSRLKRQDPVEAAQAMADFFSESASFYRQIGGTAE